MIERIRQAVSILDWIGHSVKLRRVGTQYVGLCPFHQERTPSFSVHPEKQVWHCRGCGLGGDIFAFVQRYEGVPFRQSLQILAEYAGIDLESFTPQQRAEYARLKAERERAETWIKIRIREIEELRTDYLRLYHAARRDIRDYGITEELIDDWELSEQYQQLDVVLDALRGSTGDAILAIYRSKLDAE